MSRDFSALNWDLSLQRLWPFLALSVLSSFADPSCHYSISHKQEGRYLPENSPLKTQLEPSTILNHQSALVELSTGLEPQSFKTHMNPIRKPATSKKASRFSMKLQKSWKLESLHTMCKLASEQLKRNLRSTACQRGSSLSSGRRVSVVLFLIIGRDEQGCKSAWSRCSQNHRDNSQTLKV